jgi:hypothetical protein
MTHLRIRPEYRPMEHPPAAPAAILSAAGGHRYRMLTTWADEEPEETERSRAPLLVVVIRALVVLGAVRGSSYGWPIYQGDGARGGRGCFARRFISAARRGARRALAPPEAAPAPSSPISTNRNKDPVAPEWAGGRAKGFRPWPPQAPPPLSPPPAHPGLPAESALAKARLRRRPLPPASRPR